MSAQFGSVPVGPARSPRDRWRVRGVQAYVLAVAVLLGTGVLLGTAWTGHPAVHGATILLVPAGALLVVPAVAQLVTRRGPWRVWVIAVVAGLALVGLGMQPVSHGVAWRALTVPLTLFVFGYLADQLRRRPSRAPFFVRARRRSALWMWQAYAGCWITLLVCPVFVAWGIGLIGSL